MTYFDDINEVTLTGRLTENAKKVEAKNKNNEPMSYVRVSIASNREWSTKDGAMHSQPEFNTIYFNKQHVVMAAKLCTGARIYVKGRLKKNSYKDDNGVERQATIIVAENLRILNWAKRDQQEKQDESPLQSANQ